MSLLLVRILPTSDSYPITFTFSIPNLASHLPIVDHASELRFFSSLLWNPSALLSKMKASKCLWTGVIPIVYECQIRSNVFLLIIFSTKKRKPWKSFEIMYWASQEGESATIDSRVWNNCQSRNWGLHSDVTLSTMIKSRSGKPRSINHTSQIWRK